MIPIGIRFRDVGMTIGRGSMVQVTVRQNITRVPAARNEG